jgi:hypothetical protein
MMEVSSFLVAFVQKVVVGRHMLGGCLLDCLESGLTLGRHSSVVCMRTYTPKGSDRKKFEAFECVWCQENVRPNGQAPPTQCSSCKSIFSFKIRKDKATNAPILTCTGKDINVKNLNAFLLLPLFKYKEAQVPGRARSGAWCQKAIED